MKNIIKNISKGFLFFLILAVLFEFTAMLLVPFESIKKYGVFTVFEHEILREEPDSIDVIFLGDSLTYSGIDPMTIWNNYGFATFDVADGALTIENAYKSLELTIEHEHPKIIFFEANVFFRDTTKRPQIDKVKKIINIYMPIVKYHNDWKNITFKDGYNIINSDKGFMKVDMVKKGKPFNYMKNFHSHKEFPNENEDYIIKMVELCKENNITPIFMNTPSLRTWNYGKHQRVQELADSLEVEYIDFNLDESISIDWKTETRDRGDHLNYSGAVKFSKHLGEYIKNTHMIEDKRNNENYKSWNEAYEIYEGKLKKD